MFDHIKFQDNPSNYLEKIADLLTLSRNVKVKKLCYSDSDIGEGLAPNSGVFRVVYGVRLIAQFELRRLPGCCGVCVSCHSSVEKKSRGKGLGTLLNKMRLLMAKQMGYGVLLCTDITTNEPQQKILTKNNWTHLMMFNNPRTKNNVMIHAFNLNELTDDIPLGFNCKGIAPEYFTLDESNNVEVVVAKEDS